MNKICFKCNKKKSLDSFYAHKGMSDGHLGKCKECTKKGVRERYYDPENLEKVKSYEAKRFQDPDRKEKALDYQRKRRKKYPEKDRARNLVNNHIAKGKLKKLPCVECGDIKTEGHHTNYLEPLNVTWLCRPHHMKAHKKRSFTKVEV